MINSEKSSKFYFIGLSLGYNSSHLSSVCVIDRNQEIVLLDKLYFSDDIKLFFDKSPYVKNSTLIAGLTPDESLLEGKWRIHSKNYKTLENKFQINKNNWTNRLNDRFKELFLELNNTKCDVYRCNTLLLRQAYGLKPDYLEKTSLDCKNFQAGLKMKYNFRNMPDNLLPSSSLEAMLFAMFGRDIELNNVKFDKIAEFKGLDVINKSV